MPPNLQSDSLETGFPGIHIHRERFVNEECPVFLFLIRKRTHIDLLIPTHIHAPHTVTLNHLGGCCTNGHAHHHHRNKREVVVYPPSSPFIWTLPVAW